jgi:pyridinium-3,5-bisthiocarboxylic acid mononucleotide nickel chelatase
VTRVAYLDCIGGVAGDMILAALVDAGAPQDRLTELPAALGLAEVLVEVTRTVRQGVPAAHVRVVDAGSGPDAARSADELRSAIEASSLPARAKARSLAALGRLARAEAAVHGVPVEGLRLHELGSVDTLVDLCGAFVLLEALGVERVVCSPIPYARGLVDAAHGVLPSPGPAVLTLLEGAALVGVDTEAELVTPTGAAIVAEACDAWGPLPPMTLERVGHGAGTRELPDRPNVLRVVLGTSEAAARTDVVLLESGLDDLLPELVPDAVERCVAAGAIDVWTTPVQMKKGRPGIVVSALARPEDEAAVARALLEHTSTLGVRVADLRRYELEREHREVTVAGGTIRVKLGLLDGRVVNVAPEHDDCARVAAETGRPVKQVWAEALAASQELHGSPR